MHETSTALAIALALLVVSGWTGPAPSPYDHGGVEIDAIKAPTIIPGAGPIKTEEFYRGERELFSYNPRFMPTSEVAFDAANRPLIRASLPQKDAGDGTEDGYIQTLGPDGKWLAWSIVEEIKRAYPDWTGKYGTGVRVGDTRVLTDRNGEAYTLVRMAERPFLRLLMHLRKGATQWDIYEVPKSADLRLESADRYSAESRPPLIWCETKGELSFFDLQRNDDGTLALGEPVIVVPEKGFLHPSHSGAGPSSATIGSTTYLTYSSPDPMLDAEGKPLPGTAQFVISYDRETGKVSDPVHIGFGHNCYTETPDVHNGSCMVADSEGRIHVIIGAHQHHFWHVYSKVAQPRSADDWTRPEPLGLRRRYDCGLTYVALTIDDRDVIHLIGRNMSRGTDNEGNVLPPDEINNERMTRTLDYLRATRQADGTWKWEEKGPLLVPFHRAYSIFYHKLVTDRKSRLFLTYYYYADQLSDEMRAAYLAKWPEEFAAPPAEDAKLAVRPHDPVIMMSDDGGDSWRIALTDDFLAGIEP